MHFGCVAHVGVLSSQRQPGVAPAVPCTLLQFVSRSCSSTSKSCAHGMLCDRLIRDGGGRSCVQPLLYWDLSRSNMVGVGAGGYGTGVA